MDQPTGILRTERRFWRDSSMNLCIDETCCFVYIDNLGVLGLDVHGRGANAGYQDTIKLKVRAREMRYHRCEILVDMEWIGAASSDG
eukprot:2207970-Amphidinium_carterae.1